MDGGGGDVPFDRVPSPVSEVRRAPADRSHWNPDVALTWTDGCLRRQEACQESLLQSGGPWFDQTSARGTLRPVPSAPASPTTNEAHDARYGRRPAVFAFMGG